jgi:hypothetical protein
MLTFVPDRDLEPDVRHFPCRPFTLALILSTNARSSNHSNSLLLRSSRPGRPPKRATVGLSIAASHLAHHHQLKKHRLDNGEYPGYENGHLGGKYSDNVDRCLFVLSSLIMLTGACLFWVVWYCWQVPVYFNTWDEAVTDCVQQVPICTNQLFVGTSNMSNNRQISVSLWCNGCRVGRVTSCQL